MAVSYTSDSHNSYVSNTSYDSHNQTYINNTSYDDHSVTNNVQNIHASFTDAKQVAVFGIMFGGAGEAVLMGIVSVAILTVIFWSYAVLVMEAGAVLGAAALVTRGMMRYMAQKSAEAEWQERQYREVQMLHEQRTHELRLAEASRSIGTVNITINTTQAPQSFNAVQAEEYARSLLATQAQDVRVIDQPRQQPKLLADSSEASEPIEMPVRRQKVMVKR